VFCTARVAHIPVDLLRGDIADATTARAGRFEVSPPSSSPAQPTSSALRVRAELLEQGGPSLWQEFMDELRHSHLGSGISPRSPSVRERLNAAYLAAANSS